MFFCCKYLFYFPFPTSKHNSISSLSSCFLRHAAACWWIQTNRQPSLPGIRFINDIRHLKCCCVAPAILQGKMIWNAIQYQCYFFFYIDVKVKKKQNSSFLQRGNYQCCLYSQRIHDPLSTLFSPSEVFVFQGGTII